MVADMVPTSVERDAGTGLWTVLSPARTMSQPVVAGRQVLLLVDGRLTACDRDDGSALWQSPHRIEGGEPHGTTLTPAGSRVVVAAAEPFRTRPKPERLTVLDTESGALLWQLDAGMVADHRTDGRTLVLRHAEPADRVTLAKERRAPEQLTALDLADGRRLWQHAFAWVGAVTLLDGRVIAVARDDRGTALRAFDARTGAELWRIDGHHGSLCAPDDGSPAGEQAAVFLWDQSFGRMTWLAAETGEEVGRLHLRRGLYRPRFTDGGRGLWLSYGRLVHGFRPFDSAKPGTPSHSSYAWRRRLSLCDERIAPADGWLYAIDGGRRLLGARVGSRRRSVLSQVRWPASVPRTEREVNEVDGLVAGRNHVYAQTRTRLGAASAETFQEAVVALRHGAVLWRLPLWPVHRPVPVGDRVLLVDADGTHDRLRLVDGDTGAFAGAGPR